MFLHHETVMKVPEIEPEISVAVLSSEAASVLSKGSFHPDELDHDDRFEAFKEEVHLQVEYKVESLSDEDDRMSKGSFHPDDIDKHEQNRLEDAVIRQKQLRS